MTHDTPDGTDNPQRWCDDCQLSVEPSPGEDGPECPACGGELE